MKLKILLVFFVFCVVLGQDYGSFDDGEEDVDYGSLKGMQFDGYKKKVATNLHIVYDRLATLSRIANAISLQYASIKKSIKVRDVVIELLKAQPGKLDSFTEIEATEISEKFKNRYKVFKTMGAMKKDMDKLKEKKEVLVLMNSSFAFVQTRIINESEMECFYQKIANKTFDSDTIACDKNLLKLIIDFTGLFNDQSDQIKDKTGLIQEMKANTTRFRECLKDLGNYESKIAEIRLESKNFEALEQSKENIIKFHESEEKIRHFGEVIDLTTKVFSATEKLWKSSEIVGPKLLRAIGNFEAIMKPSKTELELVYTLGFPDFGDMANVARDLKSDWFRRTIAHGKSVNELGRELRGFFRFGAQMRKLHKSWIDLNHDSPKYQEIVMRMARILVQIETKNWNKEVLEVAKRTKEAFGKAWNQKLLFKSEPDLIALLNGELVLLKTLMEKVTDVETKAQLVSEIDQLPIEDFLGKLEETDFGTDEAKNLEMIQTIANQETMKLLNSKFYTLLDAQVNLIAQIDDIRSNMDDTSQTTSFLLDLFRQSNLRKNFENLKAQGANFQPDTILNMQMYCEMVFEVIKNPDDELVVSSFLGSIEIFRKMILEVEQFVKDIGPKYKLSHTGNDSNPVLKLPDPNEIAASLGRGLKVLRVMVKAHRLRERLRAVVDYPERINQKILKFNDYNFVKEFWKTNNESLLLLVQNLEDLETYASRIKDKELNKMSKILDQASEIQGIPDVFVPILEQFRQGGNYSKPIANFEVLSKLDMDFASHKGSLHAASMSFDELREYFDVIFGLNSGPVQQEVEQNHMAAIFTCIGILTVVIIILLVAYGFTPTGRKQYKNRYLYYFGKPFEFEKRWRYSLFMDRQDGKNALLDAAREINATNLSKVVNRGAYINVYNKFGNTALHVATKRGHPDIVKILIKNGADRTLLNAQNKTAEQMLPKNWRDDPEKRDKFKRVEKIYRRCRNKTYRLRVPSEFPTTSYHIYIDPTTDDTIADKFTEKFQSIITDDAGSTTTHYVVKTDKNEIMELETLELVLWVLSGTIMVKEKWMAQCIEDPTQIQNEWDFLVDKVRFKGTVYETIGQWREAMAKSAMPFLHGFYIAVVIADYANLVPLASLIATHGGVLCERFPEKQHYNKGTKPYLHSNMGPFLIIHDGKTNLEAYRNDVDKMYTLMTEAEFVHFMMRREIVVDKAKDPVPATNDLED